MPDYKKICEPFLQKSKECYQSRMKVLESSLKEANFFNMLPASLNNTSELRNTINNSPELSSVFHEAYQKANFKECAHTIIKSNGEIIDLASYVGKSARIKISEHFMLCTHLVSFSKTQVRNIEEDNALLGMFNENGFDFKLHELPNYSPSEIEAMF